MWQELLTVKQLAKATVWCIKRNFAWAFVFNLGMTEIRIRRFSIHNCMILKCVNLGVYNVSFFSRFYNHGCFSGQLDVGG